MIVAIVTKGSVIKEVHYGPRPIDQWEETLNKSGEPLRRTKKIEAMALFYNPTVIVRDSVRGLGLL